MDHPSNYMNIYESKATFEDNEMTSFLDSLNFPIINSDITKKLNSLRMMYSATLHIYPPNFKSHLHSFSAIFKLDTVPKSLRRMTCHAWRSTKAPSTSRWLCHVMSYSNLEKIKYLLKSDSDKLYCKWHFFLNIFFNSF